MSFWIEDNLQYIAKLCWYFCGLPGIFLKGIDDLIIGGILND
jgi:hypothetical protein